MFLIAVVVLLLILKELPAPNSSLLFTSAALGPLNFVPLLVTH
jgi:hypothetical protein